MNPDHCRRTCKGLFAGPVEDVRGETHCQRAGEREVSALAEQPADGHTVFPTVWLWAHAGSHTFPDGSCASQTPKHMHGGVQLSVSQCRCRFASSLLDPCAACFASQRLPVGIHYDLPREELCSESFPQISGYCIYTWPSFIIPRLEHAHLAAGRR